MDNDTGVKSYGIGLLTDVQMGNDVTEYLERIDTTLQLFGGRFLVHGGEAEVLEGTQLGSVIVIEFPTASGAGDWYCSDTYQDIVELRTANSSGTVFVVNGVTEPHVATDVLRSSRQS